jgi:hypothetical protein
MKGIHLTTLEKFARRNYLFRHPGEGKGTSPSSTGNHLKSHVEPASTGDASTFLLTLVMHLDPLNGV